MKPLNLFFSLATVLMSIGFSATVHAQSAKVGIVKSSVSVNEAFTLVSNGATMVDVREADELAEIAYDVKGISHVPLSTLENNFSSISKTNHVILACKSGNRSQKAFNLLQEKGYANITNMEGGMMAWESAGLPVIKDGKASDATAKKACCANPSSKNCNPDGTCITPTEGTKTECCSKKSNKKSAKACCSK